MADSRVSTTTATEADVAAWAAALDLARRFGPDRAAAAALFASGHPVWPYLLMAAARNAGIDEVIRMLHLTPGSLADIVGVAIPPPSPLPPGEETVIPDDLPVRDAGPYGARSRAVLLRAVPEPVAARLAAMVPGARGIVLFAAARGDDRHDVAEVLNLSIGEIDAVLAGSDGRHLTRPNV